MDLINFRGLYTKSSPDIVTAEQLRVVENCDFFKTYGSIAKLKGSARVLSSIYQEDSVTQKIPWIGFYKASDLDGSILRHTLVSAGTTLARIDSASLTTLKTDRTADLFHDGDMFGRFMLITNQDPDKVGRGDTLVKYDGAVISDWGITPPGSEETILDTFHDERYWTKFNATATDDTDVTWDGDAINLTKSGTVDRIFHIEREFYPAFYVYEDRRRSENAPPDRLNVYTYIPRGQLTADCISDDSFDPNDAAIAAWISPDKLTVLDNHWKFYFQIGEIVEGWNRLSMDFNQAPVHLEGKFYPEDDTVKRVRFDFRMKDKSHSAAGIRMDNFHRLDLGTPILTPRGTDDNFTGLYSYKVTYISKYGQESNAGPASRTITTASNTDIFLSRLPISSDPQVTQRRIYRTVAGGSIWLFLDTIYKKIKQQKETK